MKKIFLWVLISSTFCLYACTTQKIDNQTINWKDNIISSISDDSESEDYIVCTTDVFQCPDWSYVSRQWPDCEFAKCPWKDDSLDINPMENIETIEIETSTNDTDQDINSIDDIIQKYEDNENFDEEWVDMLYEIINKLEWN